jgi:transcriptional regulator with XRE-family HTH domain
LLQQVREQHGLSQKRLAIRAGLSRSTISRIECDRVSPSIERLRELLFLMGEDLVLRSEPRESTIDMDQLEARLAMTPTERVEAGIAAATKA